MLGAMALSDEVDRAAEAAAALAGEDEMVLGIVPAEAEPGERRYLIAFARGEERTWLVLDAEGAPVREREDVRRAASIAAMCELAEESAGGGDLPDLRARLAELRTTEAPDGIDEAEAAVAELEQTILEPPRVASIEYLDTIGRAAGRLEEALGSAGGSPFAAAMKTGLAAADDLADEVERAYKLPFESSTS
jgi:hypothetical protein